MLQTKFRRLRIGLYRAYVVSILFLLIIFQETNAVNKICLGDHHYQINGIKISSAPKASGQIGCGINGRVKFIAQGAKKTKGSLRDLPWDIQCIFDHCVNGDIISQPVKLLAGKTPGSHVKQPGRV